jgi:hypothetical protein
MQNHRELAHEELWKLSDSLSFWYIWWYCAKASFPKYYLGAVYPPLQIILDLCNPEKELAKTRSQISFI